MTPPLPGRRYHIEPAESVLGKMPWPGPRTCSGSKRALRAANRPQPAPKWSRQRAGDGCRARYCFAPMPRPPPPPSRHAVGDAAVPRHDRVHARAAAPRWVGRPEHAEDVHHPVRRRRHHRRRVPVPPEKDGPKSRSVLHEKEPQIRKCNTLWWRSFVRIRVAPSKNGISEEVRFSVLKREKHHLFCSRITPLVGPEGFEVKGI